MILFFSGNGNLPKDKEDEYGLAQLFQLSFLGTQFAGTVGLFVLAGWWLDGKYETTPWCLAGLGILGVAAGMWQFLKDARK